MAQYGKQEYWDARYQQDNEPFEWYQHWAGFKDIVSPLFKTDNQILVVGCGNSRMSEDLYEDGFHNITSIDYSPVVVKAMQDKYKEKLGMQFKQMDMRQMDFPDAVFNVVLDKATIDAVLCAEGSLPFVAKCLSEISRVLSSDGVFVCISHGHPNTRLQILDKPEYGWTVNVQTVPRPMLKLAKGNALPDGNEEGDERMYHYIYTCVRK